VLLADGRLEEALVEYQRAVQLDPYFSRVADNYSAALILAGRPTQALAEAERALTLQPGNKQAQFMRAMAPIGLGRGAEAAALARVGGSLYSRDAGAVFALTGNRAAAEQILTQAGPPVSRLRALAALGRYEDCIVAIQGGAVTANGMEFLLFDSAYDPIRKDPRFQRELAESGAAEAHARAQAWRAAQAKGR